jgi:hypothetical protein
VALGVAVLYTLAFLWGAVWRYFEVQAAGRSVEWSLTADPRSVIALCFLLAIITLWQLEYVGRLVASMLFGVVITRFIHWASWTSNIKENAGLPEIADAGVIGNVWFGADPFDLLALIAAVVLLVTYGRSVWRHRGDLTRQWRNALTPS